MGGGTLETVSFRFACIFSEHMQLFARTVKTVKTVKTAKTVKPASLVPSVFEKSSRRTFGNRQNRQLFKEGSPIGSKEHLFTPAFVYSSLQPPDFSPLEQITRAIQDTTNKAQ